MGKANRYHRGYRKTRATFTWTVVVFERCCKCEQKDQGGESYSEVFHFTIKSESSLIHFLHLHTRLAEVTSHKNRDRLNAKRRKALSITDDTLHIALVR